MAELDKEKRRYPRIRTNLSAVILNQDGAQVAGVAKDASIDGLAVECSFMERNLLTPGGSFVRDGKPVELLVSLDLPVENNMLAKLEIPCHVVYSRRIARDRCKIGMRYLRLENKAYDNLIRFVESSLASDA